ncbi:MAG: cytochrome c oxidase subunit II [Candidatus Eisenbacteria bacterium]
MFHALGPSAATFSGDTDRLFWLITVIVGAWFIAAEAMFFWLMFRFRARPGVPGQYVTGKEKHLKMWINVPHSLVLVCDVVIVVAAVRVWVLVKQTLPVPDRTIRVVGQQWAWTFTDPGPDGLLDTADDVRTTDVLNVEVGKSYQFQLEARDVVHSFFIPAFRLKQDAVPGRIYTGWFRPQETGTFDILCAQMCGMGHGLMGAKLIVATAPDHAAWLEQHAGDGALSALDTGPGATDTTSAAPAAATPARR